MTTGLELLGRLHGFRYKRLKVRTPEWDETDYDPDDVTNWKWEFVAYCPYHDDVGTKPSLGIDFKWSARDGCVVPYFNCRGCGGLLNRIAARLLPDEFPGLARSALLYRYDWEKELRKLPRRPVRVAAMPIIPAVHDTWHTRHTPQSVRDLSEWRGLTEEVIREHRIGWWPPLRGRWANLPGRYVLPIYEGGQVVNLKHCQLGHKLWSLGKHVCPSAGVHLYPDVPEDSWLLLVEGEWDALMGRQHGLPTLTSTAGAQTWPPSAVAACQGRRVVVLLDSGPAGQRGAQALARSLTPVAGELRVADLGGPDGYDLTHWFRDDRRTKAELVGLIRDCSRWEKR